MKKTILLLASVAALMTSCSNQAELGAFLQIPNHENTQSVQLRPTENQQAAAYGVSNDRLTPSMSSVNE